MKTEIAITDLTRMQRGAVCIAGQDPDGHVIRPVMPSQGGVPESAIRTGNKALVFPFAVVELDLTRHIPKPPHTEDHLFDINSVVSKGALTEQQKLGVLKQSMFENVAAIFEQPIQHPPGYSVEDGRGPRSVGTIQPQGIHKIFYEQGDDDAWNYRLGFYDRSNVYYRLKITDLTWNYYCASLRTADRESAQIANEQTLILKRRSVYLRIGLSRGWAKFPGRCFLQINGIYTFPDYLDGKTFVDFLGQK